MAKNHWILPTHSNVTSKVGLTLAGPPCICVYTCMCIMWIICVLLTFPICFLFLFFFPSYLTYILPSRISPLCFQAGWQLNLVFSLLCLLCAIVFSCSCCIVAYVTIDLVIMLAQVLYSASLSFSLFSQYWTRDWLGKAPRNDLFCVEWGVKH